MLLQITVERFSIWPKWNVFLVLQALKGTPYNSLWFVSLHALARTTLFLSHWWLVRRISEIHDLLHYNADGSVTLHTVLPRIRLLERCFNLLSLKVCHMYSPLSNSDFEVLFGAYEESVTL